MAVKKLLETFVENIKNHNYGKRNEALSKGLWANIHAKRKRGETMRKKGDAGAPSEQDLIDSQ